ncbi:MAG: hypothetical protein N5P05_000213 [Chroococcopsis gigantea SAG 12.99]|jgi:hypothetical protein|nr:hypothetical protein [Chroococcopsis gigantea SAG 12.99]
MYDGQVWNLSGLIVLKEIIRESLDVRLKISKNWWLLIILRYSFMKSLIRWTATLSLVGSTLFTSLVGHPQLAYALPEEQVVKTLQTIPVFAIADDNGTPLIATMEKNQKVTGVFISLKDAQLFFDQLKKQNPDVASKVKVQTVSLAQVYKLQASQPQTDGLTISYIPKESEVESAKTLLTAQGQQYSGGVPLFVARAGKEGGYLTIKQDNQDRIPFFFEKSVVMKMVDQFKKEKPDQASTVKIEVIPLESVISTLQTSKDENLTRIMFVPTQETIDYIRANAARQGGNAAQSPAPNPQTQPKK